MNDNSSYDILRSIDVGEHIEKKGRFSYLSWAWAVDTLKKNFPDAYWTFTKFTVKGEREYTLPYMYDPITHHAYVECSVTVEDVTLEHTHPVLDNRNQPVEQPDAFQVNTAQMRCLVKCIGMHGLGLYIYAGEDLPQETLITGQVPSKGGMTVDQNIKLERLLRDNCGFSEAVKADIKAKWNIITEAEAAIMIKDAQEGVRLNRKATAKTLKDIEKEINESNMTEDEKAKSVNWLKDKPRTNKEVETLQMKLKNKEK